MELTSLPHQTAGFSRRDVLGLAARARRIELERPVREAWPDLAITDLRPAESGLVMLRGRIGGDGAPFNLGEASMSRAAVALDTGEIGYGHVLGRDIERARLVAIVDALWQRAGDRDRVEQHVLAPIRQRIARDRAVEQAKTAATRVDFFTLVRGED
ncbi:MAG TPA: phosphonate C-P lyase system protein PhnG [Rhabdaerophilum sp.]|nr:phosphonate C-P lyase system protein PhnG [Rhabdaerophilum sp.]